MYYCDAHIHLLPNIDNGPSLPVAVDMFRELKRENFRQAIATPHYDPQLEDCHRFLRRRRERYNELIDALQDDYTRFHLLLSAEVHICPGVSLVSQLDKLCIPGTPYFTGRVSARRTAGLDYS